MQCFFLFDSTLSMVRNGEDVGLPFLLRLDSSDFLLQRIERGIVLSLFVLSRSKFFNGVERNHLLFFDPTRSLFVNRLNMTFFFLSFTRLNQTPTTHRISQSPFSRGVELFHAWK